MYKKAFFPHTPDKRPGSSAYCLNLTLFCLRLPGISHCPSSSRVSRFSENHYSHSHPSPFQCSSHRYLRAKCTVNPQLWLGSRQLPALTANGAARHGAHAILIHAKGYAPADGLRIVTQKPARRLGSHAHLVSLWYDSMRRRGGGSSSCQCRWKGTSVGVDGRRVALHCLCPASPPGVCGPMLTRGHLILLPFALYGRKSLHGHHTSRVTCASPHTLYATLYSALCARLLAPSSLSLSQDLLPHCLIKVVFSLIPVEHTSGYRDVGCLFELEGIRRSHDFFPILV